MDWCISPPQRKKESEKQDNFFWSVVVVSLKKYNLQGQEIGQIEVNEQLVNAKANGQLIKDYIVALRANARQWSASTKGRSDVKHTTKKPHAQKGTGRARQGMLSAPQYRGGGRVFGPKPKFDQHVKINRKERKAAIRCLIGEKIRANRVHVIETTEMEQPKTKAVAQFLKNCQLNGRVLFIGEGRALRIEDSSFAISLPTDAHASFIRSMRNIPKVDFSLATNLNGYHLLLAQELVLTESALEEINEWLS